MRDTANEWEAMMNKVHNAKKILLPKFTAKANNDEASANFLAGLKNQ